MKLTFLGTACMVPTRERSHAAAFLELEPYGILIDCGEGTQRQLKIADIRPTRITHILLSHWHGDHVLGLPGFLQTLASMEPNHHLTIIGPKGTKRSIDLMKKAFLFEPALDLTIIEAGKDLSSSTPLIKNSEMKIFFENLEHGMPTIGFRIEQTDKIRIDKSKLKKLGVKEGAWLNKVVDGKTMTVEKKKISPEDITYTKHGKVVAMITDTVMCSGCHTLAKDADLLVCESAYHSKLEEKALEYKHLTSAQAAQLASQEGVGELIITHFSQRYKSPDELLEEAKDIFPNTSVAFDFMKKKI